MEREEGTFEFLRAAPITARQVLASKLAVTCLATLAMFIVLWPATLLFTYPKSPHALDGMLGLWLMAALEAIAWGTLFSLLTARPLGGDLPGAGRGFDDHASPGVERGAGQPHESEFAPYLAAVPWRR